MPAAQIPKEKKRESKRKEEEKICSKKEGHNVSGNVSNGGYFCRVCVEK